MKPASGLSYTRDVATQMYALALENLDMNPNVIMTLRS